MLHRHVLRFVFAAVVAVSNAAVVHGQMQLHARVDAAFFPVARYKDGTVIVLREGRLRRAEDQRFEIRRGPNFADGFVTINDVRADFDPLRDESLKKKTHPDAIRFRYAATLVSESHLNDCYALLTFITQGSIQRQLIEIGRLPAKKSKEIEVELRSHVDALGSLHIFERTSEVRSTAHPEAYDVAKTYADLLSTTKGVPAAELIKIEHAPPHQLSNDGRLLATIRKQGAVKSLIVYDLSSMQLLSQVQIAEANDPVGDLTWISDHELAYIAEVDSKRYSDDGVHLWLFDLRKPQPEILLKHVGRIITALPGQRHVLVVGGRGLSSIYKFDVRTKKSFDYENSAYGSYLFDRNGVARVRLRIDDDKYEFVCRPTPESEWQRIDDLVRQPGLRFDFRSAEWLDRSVEIQSVGPEGDTLIVSTRLGTDCFELAAFSMSEGVIKKTIARHPHYDLGANDSGVTRLLFRKNSTELLGLIFEAQKPQILWLHPDYKAVQQAIDRTFPEHINFPIDWSEDGSTFIFRSSNDRDPGSYHVFRTAENRLIPVLQLGAHLAGRELARTSALQFHARDGKKIFGYVTRPSHQTGPAPLLVMVHGGPTVRDTWNFDATNQFFATRGYIVLQVNYRGSSGFGATYQNEGLRARLDTVVIDDIADGVKYLIDSGEADPARVAIMGASFGGWATYISLAKYPELYRAGIAIAAVSSWRKTLRNDRRKFGNISGYRFWKALLEREDFKTDEPFIEPLLRAHEIKQPLFIIHGERDYVVHATESREMLNALRKHNPNVQAKSFPNAGHGNWSDDENVIYLNEVAVFLDHHLTPSPAPAQVAQ